MAKKRKRSGFSGDKKRRKVRRKVRREKKPLQTVMHAAYTPY